MFRGVNTLNLDAKGRLAIPSKYRERLMQLSDGQLIVTVDKERCLLLYPLPDWEEIEHKLIRLPTLNKQVRRYQRLLLGHATECELDGNGRILLSPPLRDFASLDRKIVLIGQGNKFEIWNEDNWNIKRDEWLEEDDDDEGLPPELESLTL